MRFDIVEILVAAQHCSMEIYTSVDNVILPYIAPPEHLKQVKVENFSAIILVLQNIKMLTKLMVVSVQN